MYPCPDIPQTLKHSAMWWQSDTSEAVSQNKPCVFLDWLTRRHKPGAIRGQRGLNDRMLAVRGNYCNTHNFFPLISSSNSIGSFSSCFLNRCQISLSHILKHQLCVEDTWNFSISDWLLDLDLITKVHNSISDPRTLSHVLLSILFLECWLWVSVCWLIKVNFIQDKYRCNIRNMMTLLLLGL